MPAAAVIPAPIAYTKVVAVKKLVVNFWMRKMVGTSRCLYFSFASILGRNMWTLKWVCLGIPSFTVSKIECSKQAYAVEYISME